MKENDFEWLIRWYHSNCDGDWEHASGVRIDTIDNPGWGISISLEGTELEHKKFQEIEINNSEKDWLICFIKNTNFEGRCSTLNLLQVLHIFRSWAEEVEEII
jgi:hypothetical protein